MSKAKTKRLPMALDKAEIDALKSAPNTHCPTGLRNRAILEAMHGAGLRVSEAVDLRPADIRWESGIIEVHEGKGGMDRNIPIKSETVGWLRAWQAKRPKGHYFFCTLQGGRVSPRYVQQMIKRYAHKAKMERAAKVTPHTLRHTFATDKMDEGFSIREVQFLLGHRSVKNTEIYTHVNPVAIAAKIQGRHESADSDLVAKLKALTPEAKRALLELLKT